MEQWGNDEVRTAILIRINPSVPAGEILYSRLVWWELGLRWWVQSVWSGGREILSVS